MTESKRPSPKDKPKGEPKDELNAANQQQRRFGVLFTASAWLILLLMLVLYFTQQQEQQNNPNHDPQGYREGDFNKLVLQANRYNHFVVTGEVNGKKATFLLDTGATVVAVPEKMAAKFGLKKGIRGYSQTANGESISYSTRIATLQLGDIQLYDVPASISPGMNGLDEILLGMSALSQIEFSQRNGELTLTQAVSNPQ